MYADYIFPDLRVPGAVGVRRVAPERRLQGAADPPARDRPADRDGHGLRRGDAALVRGDDPRARREARAARFRAGRSRRRTELHSPRGPLPADGRERRRGRQGGPGRGGFRGGDAQLFLEARSHLPKTVFDPERWAGDGRPGLVVAASSTSSTAAGASTTRRLRRREAEEPVRQAAQPLPGEDRQGGERDDGQALPGRRPLHPRAPELGGRADRRRVRLPPADDHVPRDHAHQVAHVRRTTGCWPFCPRTPSS